MDDEVKPFCNSLLNAMAGAMRAAQVELEAATGKFWDDCESQDRWSGTGVAASRMELWAAVTQAHATALAAALEMGWSAPFGLKRGE